MPLANPLSIKVVCPYCRSQQVVTFIRIYPSTEDIICNNPKCTKEWHQGVFRTSITVVCEQAQKEFPSAAADYGPPGLLMAGDIVYIIRCKTDTGGEDLITFREEMGEPVPLFNTRLRQEKRGIVIKKGDVIALDFKKKSKGLLHKTWIGDWEDEPTIFQNVTDETCWHLHIKPKSFGSKPTAPSGSRSMATAPNKCPFCEFEIQPGDVFCTNCGKKIAGEG